MEKQPNIPKESIPGDRHTSRHNELEIDVYKLIHLAETVPEKEIVMEDYLSELDEACWTDNNGEKVTPRSVIEIYKEGLTKAIQDRPELSEHLQKIDRADYSHPILIFEARVIDGIHRMAKAYSDGEDSIKAKVIGSIPKEAIIKIYD